MARVGVVLPAYNAGNYLREAVDSVLAQTYRDFQLFVIDDGSTDGSMNTIADADPRLTIVSIGSNRGMVHGLNRGLGLAEHCEFIARMDADDLCLPDRFARQVDYLDHHPEIGVLGGAHRIFGDVHLERNRYYPGAHEVIAAALVAKNPFSHPTVMLRTSMVAGCRYDPGFPKYEDYALWIDLLGRCRLANVPRVLLRHRRHRGNATDTYRDDPQGDVRIFSRILARYAERRGLRFDEETIHVLSVLTSFTRAAQLPRVHVRRAIEVVDEVVAQVATEGPGRHFASNFLYGCALAYAGRTGQLSRYVGALARHRSWQLGSMISIQLRGV